MLAAAVLAAMTFRPPAIPLVTHTPFFSCWQMADRLTDRWPQHWSGSTQAMCGLLRVDGKVYRWLGGNPWLPSETNLAVAEQTSVEVTATRSIFRFTAGGVELRAEFCSPLLTGDLDLLARPATYVTLTALATDGKRHDVQAYFDATGEWVVGHPSQVVAASRFRLRGSDALAIRSQSQPVLQRSGDRVPIDWGTLYLHGPGKGHIGGHAASRQAFIASKSPDSDDLRFPRRADDDWPVLAFRFPLREKPQTVILAYDEDFAIQYFRRNLRPYWNRRENGPTALLTAAVDEAARVQERCRSFDQSLRAEAERAGGHEYADLLALAYRQCLAGHGMVEDERDGLLFFSKENSSNGCMATVDVIFPAAPFFLYHAPRLLKAQLDPILAYSASSRWKFPFAPHDLGQYPLSNGQVYGGGERDETNQMPVEETANMLLMIAAICRTDGDYEYARPHAATLAKWADYLRAKGLDPENQLCTDDFTGHLAHNANLSAKAIIALRAYSELASGLGNAEQGKKDEATARQWVAEWLKMAREGNSTRLAFDKPGTWSLKYNLLWDRLLGYDLFPDEVIRNEVESTLGRMNEFGAPLDNRADFTKTDWLLWVGAMARDKDEFRKFVLPVHRMISATPDRLPFTDWYDTKTARNSGFHARTVIGGIWARLLVERGLGPQKVVNR